jgi:large subunit ribosomal protein L10
LNKDQKRAAVAEIAEQIKGSDAVFAVDYRGLSVPQAAELRTRLREADATFRVVKNTLTERAADAADAETLKALLEGPTALTFVHGDAALAAKAITGYARGSGRLAFKGGLLGGEPLDAEQVLAISRLPARDVLFGQLVGVVASPITGVVRTLNALIAGLASQLGQIAEQRGGEEPPAGAAGGPDIETPDQDAEPPQPAASPDAPAEGAAGEADSPSNDEETTT